MRCGLATPSMTPKDTGSELNSGASAARSLKRAGADSHVAQRRPDLVIAPKHGVPTALASRLYAT